MCPKERCKSKFWGKLSTSSCANDQKPNEHTNPGQVSHKPNEQEAAFKTALQCAPSAADPTGTLVRITACGMLTKIHGARPRFWRQCHERAYEHTHFSVQYLKLFLMFTATHISSYWT